MESHNLGGMIGTVLRNIFGPEAIVAFIRVNAGWIRTASSLIIYATVTRQFQLPSTTVVREKNNFKYQINQRAIIALKNEFNYVYIGIITDKAFLPITQLNFGRTQFEISSGAHTLGRFECTGQVSVNGMPRSCFDLWKIGHTLSGIYSIMGSNYTESVYCDFARLPTDQGKIYNTIKYKQENM